MSNENDKLANLGCGFVIALFFIIPLCITIFDEFNPLPVRICGFSILFGIIYFVPTIIAIYREHFYSLQIFLLNTFGGMSFIGWLGSLIWATLPNKRKNETDLLIPLIITYIIFIVIFYFVATYICNQYLNNITDY